MPFRSLGTLRVSVVGLGCNQLSTAFCEPATALRIVGEAVEAVEAGITFFDTADEYGVNYSDDSDPRGWGRSEEQLGRALRGRRDQVVLASKFGVRSREDPAGSGANARWVKAAVEGRLRRLGTDYLDLYQLHFPDPVVPIAETLAALGDLLREGKVREIGCSNVTPEQLREAATTATELSLRPFASTQGALSLLQRARLADVLPACQELQMAFIPHWPLASDQSHLQVPARSAAAAVRPRTRPRSHRTGLRLAARTALGRHGYRWRRAARPGGRQRGSGRLDAERRRGRRGHPAGRRGGRM